MNFPRLVFKCPGQYQCQGGNYDHKSVEDRSQFDEAIAAGWFATVPHALDNVKPAIETKTYPDGSSATGTAPLPDQSSDQQDAAAVTDEAVPTREELEQKANELDIKFASNISDAKLAARIAEALKA